MAQRKCGIPEEKRKGASCPACRLMNPIVIVWHIDYAEPTVFQSLF
jgi:hypothetical protein